MIVPDTDDKNTTSAERDSIERGEKRSEQLN